MHVPADDVGAIPTGTMQEHRHGVPRRPPHQVHDRNDLGRLLPAHQIVVAVGQHDDIAPVRPMPFAAGQRDPASPRRDDVEQDHALRPGDGGLDEIYAGARFLDHNGHTISKVESNRIVDDL
jgi:hypothetical protein